MAAGETREKKERRDEMSEDNPNSRDALGDQPEKSVPEAAPTGDAAASPSEPPKPLTLDEMPYEDFARVVREANEKYGTSGPLIDALERRIAETRNGSEYVFHPGPFRGKRTPEEDT